MDYRSSLLQVEGCSSTVSSPGPAKLLLVGALPGWLGWRVAVKEFKSSYHTSETMLLYCISIIW